MPRFRIRVEGISLRLRIGAYPGELDSERQITVNVEIEGDWEGAAIHDDLSMGVDYGALSVEIRRSFSGRTYRLMEALALDLLRHVLGKKGVRWARVEVVKDDPIEGASRSIVSAEGTPEELC